MVAIAVVVVVGGLGLSFIGRGGGSAPVASSGRLPGSPLDGAPAAGDLAVIASGGEPPADVLSSLSVPAGATLDGHHDTDALLAPFDRSISLSVQAPPADVVDFYKVELPHGGWSVLGAPSKTGGGGGTELFYQRAGRDGYEWEAVVIVTPVTPSLSPALGGGDQTAPTSLLELNLVQVEDAS